MTSTTRIGGHVDQVDPLDGAKDIGANIVQIFLGDPQKWDKPSIAYAAGADALRADAKAADVRIVVHSAYGINVASSNNRLRIPSRKLLQQTVDVAAEFGAFGVVVHGGHVTKDEDPQLGFDNWRKCVDQLDFKVPVLIENTAGGDKAMARRLEMIERLWDAVGHTEVGFVLDTCHAWAGGIDLPTAAEKVKAITGRIDLVHANNSRDTFDSGRDRHASFEGGTIDRDELIAAIRAADAPTICETPGATIADDIALLHTA